MRVAFIVLTLGLALSACAPAPPSHQSETEQVDALARRHVDLVIALGRHDAFTATNFYGPAAWRDAVPMERVSIPKLVAQADALQTDLLAHAKHPAGQDQARVSRLIGEVEAFKATAHFIAGGTMPMAEEAARIYGLTFAAIPEAEIAEYRRRVDEALPGPAPLAERYRAYARGITVPVERLEQAARLAVEECKRRTLARIALPEDGGAAVDVRDVAIAAEILYARNYRSTLVFKRRPFAANRLLQLACHEGYPGHHLYAMLRERRAVSEGRPEDFLWPWRGVDITEGSADFGVRAIFSEAEEARFMRDVLLPAAGLDPKAADALARVSQRDWELKTRVTYEAARRMLSGAATRAEVERWLSEQGLVEQANAASWLDFADAGGAGALAYFYGHERARNAVEAAGPDPERRWQAYLAFISAP